MNAWLSSLTGKKKTGMGKLFGGRGTSVVGSSPCLCHYFIIYDIFCVDEAILHTKQLNYQLLCCLIYCLLPLLLGWFELLIQVLVSCWHSCLLGCFKTSTSSDSSDSSAMFICDLSCRMNEPVYSLLNESVIFELNWESRNEWVCEWMKIVDFCFGLSERSWCFKDDWPRPSMAC